MDELQQQIDELKARLDARDIQQLKAPLDDVSKAVVGSPISNGAGSVPLTQTIGTAGATATVPAAYSGTRVLIIDGAPYNIPYL